MLFLVIYLIMAFFIVTNAFHFKAKTFRSFSTISTVLKQTNNEMPFEIIPQTHHLQVKLNSGHIVQVPISILNGASSNIVEESTSRQDHLIKDIHNWLAQHVSVMDEYDLQQYPLYFYHRGYRK